MMEQTLHDRELLEYLTLRLRHAVSNGEYITVDMLERLMATYRLQPEVAIAE